MPIKTLDNIFEKDRNKPEFLEAYLEEKAKLENEMCIRDRYKAEAAPFNTSMRSIELVGIELRPPLPLRFIGTPFMRIKDPRSRPRIFTRLSIAPYSRPVSYTHLQHYESGHLQGLF